MRRDESALDPGADELARVVGVHVDAAVAPGVGERRHGAEDADRERLGRLVGVDQAGLLGRAHERDDVGEVDGAALAEQLGVRGVGPLDVEQGEVAGVLGVEPHAGLGALADPGQRIGRRGPSPRPGPCAAAVRIVRTSSANSSCLVGKYQ